MRELDPMLDGRATIAMSNTLQVDEAISGADLVIGAVLCRAPGPPTSSRARSSPS